MNIKYHWAGGLIFLATPRTTVLETTKGFPGSSLVRALSHFFPECKSGSFFAIRYHHKTWKSTERPSGLDARFNIRIPYIIEGSIYSVGN